MSLLNKYEHWRVRADALKLELQERFRVEWMIYYEKEAKGNAIKTCQYFGISKKTFYKWLNRFTRSRKDIESLKNISRRPRVQRRWEISKVEEDRIKQLRQKHIHYGKKKLKILYRKQFAKEISCWKIERVIRKHNLYPDKERQNQIARELGRARIKSKRSFTKLERKKNIWFLFQVDTIVLYWQKSKRYIITAIDHYSKLGYARMYKTAGAKVEHDFLYRLNYLIQQPIENEHQENIKDSTNHFDMALSKLIIKKKFFSKVNTPKNSTEIERFNETLEYEWLFDGNLNYDCDTFNKNLIAWLVEYNFNRPHQSLNYLTPVEYIRKKSAEAALKKKLSPGELVEKVVEYVSKLDVVEIETLSVDKIAIDLNIDRKKFWRYFKKEKKITPKEYIFRTKICFATYLLKKYPGLTVKEVAEKIGYYSYSYFIRIFKQYFGITPGKYRELIKKGKE